MMSDSVTRSQPNRTPMGSVSCRRDVFTTFSTTVMKTSTEGMSSGRTLLETPVQFLKCQWQSMTASCPGLHGGPTPY